MAADTRIVLKFGHERLRGPHHSICHRYHSICHRHGYDRLRGGGGVGLHTYPLPPPPPPPPLGSKFESQGWWWGGVYKMGKIFLTVLKLKVEHKMSVVPT